MADVPQAARDAAHEATACRMGEPGWTEMLGKSPHDLIDIALEAAASLIRADERKRWRRQIDPAKLRLLADWFDIDDELKAAQFPTCGIERGSDVQADLRRWADLLEDGNG